MTNWLWGRMNPGLLVILSLAAPASPAGASGQQWPSPPAALGLARDEPVTVAHLREALETGRSTEARQTAEILIEELPRGRTRDAVLLALG
ncbi:MAG: hypothetical protein AAF211_15765, partial [Myxococcota bacterium]